MFGAGPAGIDIVLSGDVIVGSRKKAAAHQGWLEEERKSTTRTGDIVVGTHGHLCDRWLNLGKKEQP